MQRVRKGAPRLDDELAQQAVDLYERFGNYSDAAREAGIPRTTFRERYDMAVTRGFKRSQRAHKTTGRFNLPKSRAVAIEDVRISGVSKVLVISDIHIPYHDTPALNAALEYGYKRGADCIVINGDLLDLAPMSDHEKIPDRRMSLSEDLEACRHFIAELVREFPAAKLIWHEGNHEFRAPRYFMRHAKELYNTEMGEHGIWLPRKTMFPGLWVRNSQTMQLGKLNIIHGNQYKGGGIMAARTIFLRALDNVLSSDKHRTQEYIDKRIGGQIMGSWITGHLSEERPEWLSHNRWNHGWAFVEVDADGDGGFAVENYKWINGKVR